MLSVQSQLQVLVYINPNSDTATTRRRIIQQPLRTEPPLALIVGDPTSLGELEARLKRDHQLITFPSFAHFLAEPPRREPWRAIVVARSGAWDSRLDGYVRRRSNIALFSLPEESYGWPETVARVRDMTELDPWLESLNAPDPPRTKERVKRTPRRIKTTLLSDLTARSTTEATRAPEAPTNQAKTQEPAATPDAASSSADAVTTPKTRQLVLPGLSAQGGRAGRPEKRPPGRPPKAKVGRPTRAEARSATQPPAPVRRPQVEKRTRLDSAREVEFTRLAAELGLVRAVQVLDELRARARNVLAGRRRTR